MALGWTSRVNYQPTLIGIGINKERDSHQFSEDGESRLAPNFGTRDYWQQEMCDLADQLARIRNAP